jgi:hypothetical protein
MIRAWRGGDRVLVRQTTLDGTHVEWLPGRVLRSPCEARKGLAVAVDCDDGYRRFVDAESLRPTLTLVKEAE